MRSLIHLVYLIELSYLCSSYALWAIYRLQVEQAEMPNIFDNRIGRWEHLRKYSNDAYVCREIKPLRIKTSPEDCNTDYSQHSNHLRMLTVVLWQ